MSESESANPAHVLVEEAYELMDEKLEQDEITQADIEECEEALREATEHPEQDIWVTITAEGPKNQLHHHRYPEGRYEYPPSESKREALQKIVSHGVRVTRS